MTTVINLRDAAAVKRAQDDGTFVRIDRRTPYGNPFKITKTRTRTEVIDAYFHWVGEDWNDPKAIWIRRHVHELDGKVLGCWCAPIGSVLDAEKPWTCHGQVLAHLSALMARAKEKAGAEGGRVWSLAPEDGEPFHAPVAYEPFEYTMTKEEAIEHARRTGGNLFYEERP